jgi:flagellar hook-basal body complex protein FliE
MPDFISSIGAASGGRADLVSRLAAIREAAQGGATSGIQGGDSARKITVDIGAGEPTSFGATLTRVLNEVSSTQDRASDAVTRFVRGEHVEMHEVMAATEEAGIALEMLVELRNKLTDAYRTLINMQS